RPYPPTNLPPIKSQLGGLPLLPSLSDWPRTSTGKALHFLARIDCCELPDRRGPLPLTGILQFFARIDDDLGWAHRETDNIRVLYYPAAEGFTMAEAPDDLEPIEGDYHRFDRMLRLPDEPRARVYQRWPLSFGTIRSWPSAARDQHHEK